MTEKGALLSRAAGNRPYYVYPAKVHGYALPEANQKSVHIHTRLNLERAGFIEKVTPGYAGTYRITPAGRAALGDMETKGESNER